MNKVTCFFVDSLTVYRIIHPVNLFSYVAALRLKDKILV